MPKTFKAELEAAGYDEAEIATILEKLGLASVGQTLERLQELLPTEVTEDFHTLSDEERVAAILKAAAKEVTKEQFQTIQTKARQDLIDDFTQTHTRT